MKTTLEKEMESAQKTAEKANEAVKAIADKIAKQKEASKPKNTWETIKTLIAVYAHLKCNPKKDAVKVDKFTKEEHEVLHGIIERMRICKVYNDNELPAKNQRWFPWHTRKSAGSGLVFFNSHYDDVSAGLNSASRLSFISDSASSAYAENFLKTEEKIIQL